MSGVPRGLFSSGTEFHNSRFDFTRFLLTGDRSEVHLLSNPDYTHHRSGYRGLLKLILLLSLPAKLKLVYIEMCHVAVTDVRQNIHNLSSFTMLCVFWLFVKNNVAGKFHVWLFYHQDLGLQPICHKNDTYRYYLIHLVGIPMFPAVSSRKKRENRVFPFWTGLPNFPAYLNCL